MPNNEKHTWIKKNWIFLFYFIFQLNQQSQAKGTGPQDLSFLKEASPIYVTSLTNNHVSGTTTLTTTSATTIVANCITGSNNQNNNQNLTQHQLEQRAFTAQNKIAANNLKEKGLQQQLLLQAASLLTATTTTSPPSIITTTTTNNQQFNNLNNNNINSNNCGAGVNTLNNYYGNNTNTEVIANGHGPRREVRFFCFCNFYCLHGFCIHRSKRVFSFWEWFIKQKHQLVLNVVGGLN